MNTECMYILGKKTVEEAKKFAMHLENLAIRKNEDVSPTYISVVTEDFKVTSDYDGYNTPFKVKRGDMIVWAYGKDYCMNRIRPKGAKRGFPYALNPNHSFNEKIKDLWVVRRDTEMRFVDFVECK